MLPWDNPRPRPFGILYSTLASLLLVGAAPSAHGQQAPVEGLDASPALAAWTERFETSGPAAEQAFWGEIQEAGAPLV
ncbi:MAG: hypothetical protein ACODAB_03225, partial [Gemmatimonadota bacterium]